MKQNYTKRRISRKTRSTKKQHGGRPLRKKKVDMKALSRKVKKEACSPHAKNRNSIKGSCFTDGNLVDLKNTFNKKHKEESTVVIACQSGTNLSDFGVFPCFLMLF